MVSSLFLNSTIVFGEFSTNLKAYQIAASNVLEWKQYSGLPTVHSLSLWSVSISSCSFLVCHFFCQHLFLHDVLSSTINVKTMTCYSSLTSEYAEEYHGSTLERTCASLTRPLPDFLFHALYWLLYWSSYSSPTTNINSAWPVLCRLHCFGNFVVRTYISEDR